MALIPQNDQLIHNLNTKIIFEEPRAHSGLSGIGDPCHRKLQYEHYWASRKFFSTRIMRLFGTGHRAEPLMIADLEEQGYVISGEQDEIVASGGHWLGHIDGIAEKDGERYLLEMKTHNDKSFKSVKKKGVKESKIVHYAQMQTYMGYKRINWSIYMAYNKNDSEYYIEFVPFDEEYFKELQRKEVEILSADTLLPRIGNNSRTWFECKLCDHKDVCFKIGDPVVTCRTCKNVDILNEGKWFCTINNKNLNTDEQRKACGEYELGEMFCDKA